MLDFLEIFEASGQLDGVVAGERGDSQGASDGVSGVGAVAEAERHRVLGITDDEVEIFDRALAGWVGVFLDRGVQLGGGRGREGRSSLRVS
ncbi:hypothetical protein AB0K00_45370 [Dactylosporangium sp. NPDC049525]|uniref:hypothetical protein n=1 Tax=Dactylosporangium sp. NPDC049525 TaxID=3154730 RepID=UPI003425609A